MKKINIGFISALLCVVVIFASSCSKQPNNDANVKQDVAMGRYVEQKINCPEGIIGIGSFLHKNDDTINIYAYTDDRTVNNKTSYMKMYNISDGINFTEQNYEWYEEVINHNDNSNLQYKEITKITYDANDNPYLLIYEIDKNNDVNYRVEKVVDGKNIEEIDMKWQKSENINYNGGLSAKDIYILDNGDILIAQIGIGIVQYGSDGMFRNTYKTSDFDQSFAVSGKYLYIRELESNAVFKYDYATHELSQTIAYDNLTEDSYLHAGKAGAIYILNRSGVHRLAEGGSLWEKIIDGDLTSLRIPSLYFSDMIETDNNEFYIVAGDGNGSCMLLKYTYDENTPTIPGQELVVYTLRESKILRQTAGELQQKFPDIKVNIKVGIGADDAVTPSDAIKAVNTELLAGKGPDVILLDEMPIDSYISKGVMADLSGVVNDLNKSNELLLDNVVNTYKNNDKIFAIPTKFSLPVMWVGEEYKNQFKNLNDVAEFAKSKKDLSLINDMSPEMLMRIFYTTCAPYWLNESKAIDDAKFAEFLEDIKEISNCDRKTGTIDDSNENYIIGTGSMAIDWAYGRTYSYIQTLNDYNTSALGFLGAEQRGDGTAVLLPGQASNVFIPKCVVGINAKSSSIDTAKEFVKIMLSQTVQSAKISEGISVNIASLEHGAKAIGNENNWIGLSNTTGDESLQGPMPNEEQLNQIKELCLKLTTPSVEDSELMEMIINETKGYFAGQKTVEQAVSDVKEKTKLYLSE